ncbi:HAD-IA family hydrolase [Alteromonadaceae bacterium BrNp21-10]|nr:HAD-IA family hydrolase [Alteromonadaceae bacterium BrNp21-10]
MIFYRPWRPVQALSFDLDDTLYHNDPVLFTAEANTLKYLQQFSACEHTDKAFWQNAKGQVLSHNPSLNKDMTLLRRASLEYGLEQCGYQGQELSAKVELAFHEFYRLRSDFKVSEEVQQTLGVLSQRMPLVAITNGNVNVDSIGLGGIFQHCFHASIKQPMKPHPIMFERCSAVLNIAPQQILHIGDNLIKDVYGALKVGFKSAWLAVDREMILTDEPQRVLPHIQLANLGELLDLFVDTD